MTSSSTFEVLVADLRRQPGSRRRFRAKAPLADLGISTAAVPLGSDIHVDFELESLSNAIVVTGTVTAPWVGQCRRCLQDVAGEECVEIREIFEPKPTDGETYLLGSDVIDLEPMVRDAVILALPLAPLCTSSCAGPVPDKFPTGCNLEDQLEGTNTTATIDPRWAGLDQISFDD